MTVPWWVWVLIALWCLPGVYGAVALLLQKPIGGLDEEGNVPRPIPIWRKLLLFPVVLILLIALWPLVLWSEYRHFRQRDLQEIRLVREPRTWGAGILDDLPEPVTDSSEALVVPQRVAALTEIGRQACLSPLSVAIDPAWLTSDVVAIATGIREENAFDRMPILADALQDAGCNNEGMLRHCRQQGGHVCGCWLLGLILSKS